MSAHALAILFLPGFVGKLLRNDRIATLHNLMHKLSMEAFAMSGQLALPRSEPVSGSLVPLAVTPTALKAHLLGLSQADSISRLIGTGSELLCRIAVNVIGNPGRSGARRTGMKSIFGEAVLLTKLGEQGMTLLLTGLGKSSGELPARISPHLLKPFHGLSQERIVETAGRFKMRTQLFCLLAVYLKRQFQQERGRLTFAHGPFAPQAVLIPHQPG